ncbi:unnamed protein product [Adineta ricciae]|uniref:Uncharacterized protein n=1 Tax=Adineta ricciae TaxID=249248 RepID=A0A813MWW8_ADIRI|nr:unnamed protein product [Adineta ricciae]CAF1361728.1 unnamed protein product [Adineta ricciae]
MTRRNQNNLKKKRLHRSFALNTNASIVNPTSRLESMANVMIEELRGIQRNDLKEELLKTYATKTVVSPNHSTFSSSKRNFEKLLSNLHTFDHYVNTRDENKQGQRKHTEISQNESSPVIVPKCKTRRKKHSNFASSMNEMTRTICTRSTKLNSSNDQNNPIISSPVRKRSSSLAVKDDDVKETSTTDKKKHVLTEKLTEHCHPKAIGTDNSNFSCDLILIFLGDDVSSVKVSRRRLRSVLPSSSEHAKLSNDF